ncbi:MAG: OmpH/Skp family outer membrane protein [Bacteroidia bacterium]
MKTMIRTLALVIGLISLAGTASAQKFAHVNTDSLVSEMSLKDSIQAKLDAKRLGYTAAYQMLSDEIQKAETEYNKRAADPTMPPSVLALSRKTVENLYEQARQFEQQAGTEMQEYEVKIMEPVISKIKKAIEEVAKEKGYTYVINDQVLLVSPPSDDITNSVRKKLGL